MKKGHVNEAMRTLALSIADGEVNNAERIHCNCNYYVSSALLLNLINIHNVLLLQNVIITKAITSQTSKGKKETPGSSGGVAVLVSALTYSWRWISVSDKSGFAGFGRFRLVSEGFSLSGGSGRLRWALIWCMTLHTLKKNMHKCSLNCDTLVCMDVCKFDPPPSFF